MIGSCANRCVSLNEVKSLLAVGYSLHVLYDYFTKKKEKKKDLFRTFGFCISRIIDIPRIRYLHSMWKKTIVPIFRTIDSCSKYREIPEAFNPFCASCSSILLNIKRITLVFFAKEKDKEWQWNVLSSYFFRPNLMSRIFWHDLRVRLRVWKEATSDRGPDDGNFTTGMENPITVSEMSMTGRGLRMRVYACARCASSRLPSRTHTILVLLRSRWKQLK